MERNGSDPGRLRVRRKTLESLLAECQRAIQSGTLELEGGGADDSADDSEPDDCAGSPSSANFPDETTERQLCDLIKSRVECPDFLQKLESAQASASLYMAEESASWDMVNENDVWEGDKEFDQEDYVLVRQEDILDGIACFMATYLLSLKETKELTPNQLQDVLCKAFSVKKKKGKLRKAWDGSKVIYNVASWGATAIGIYQNPAILKAASAAFWTSCHVISKFF